MVTVLAQHNNRGLLWPPVLAAGAVITRFSTKLSLPPNKRSAACWAEAVPVVGALAADRACGMSGNPAQGWHLSSDTARTSPCLSWPVSKYAVRYACRVSSLSLISEKISAPCSGASNIRYA